MTHSQQRLLSQLATSDNKLASGLGQCLEALRLISALPPSTPSLITKAFGREPLSRVPLHIVITLIKTSLPLPDPSPPPSFSTNTARLIQRPYSSTKSSRRMVENITLALLSAPLLYREDSTINLTPMLVNEDSWKELAPYVHAPCRGSRQLPAYRTVVLFDDSRTVASGIMGMSANGHGPTATLDTSFSLNGNGYGLNFNALAFAPSSNAI